MGVGVGKSAMIRSAGDFTGVVVFVHRFVCVDVVIVADTRFLACACVCMSIFLYACCVHSVYKYVCVFVPVRTVTAKGRGGGGRGRR